VAAVAVPVLLQPGKKIIRAARLDDLVIERADHAGLDHLDLGLAWCRNHPAKTAADAAKAATQAAEAATAELTTRHQMRLRELAPLEDGVDGHFLEEVARHLVEFGFAGRGDDHAEVPGIALELRLHGERLDLFDRVPGDEHLLRGLLYVLILGREVATGRVS